MDMSAKGRVDEEEKEERSGRGTGRQNKRDTKDKKEDAHVVYNHSISLGYIISYNVTYAIYFHAHGYFHVLRVLLVFRFFMF